MVKKNNTDNTKIVSILSYFLVGIIWYFINEKVRNKTTKFHVKQASNLIIINFVISIILSILMSISGILFFAGVFGIIIMLFKLTIFVLWVIGLINAINLKEQEIPLIGIYADKYLKF